MAGNPRIAELGAAYRWKPGEQPRSPGRPKMGLAREIAREIAATIDPKTKKAKLWKLVEKCFERGAKGSLGHAQLFISLIETDVGEQVVGGIGAAELLVALRVVYTLGSSEEGNQESAGALPLRTVVDQRQEPTQDRGKEP